MKRFRGGLVFKAHRLFVSLNSRLEGNKEVWGFGVYMEGDEGCHLTSITTASPTGPVTCFKVSRFVFVKV